MKKVYQKQLNNKEKGIRGDCFRACVCSLLEIEDMMDIPNFVETSDWIQSATSFANSKGFDLCGWDAENGKPDEKYYIACGVSPRGLRHSVIYSNNKLYHDPHPNGGDVKDIFAYWWVK
jgi:hypothetical protein